MDARDQKILVMLHDQLVGAVNLLDLMIETAVPAAPACPHAEDDRDMSATTMGHVRWVCRACGYRHGFEE
jgi:hypothetical protein